MINGVLNIPENLPVDWPLDRLLAGVDDIWREGGIISIKAHVSDSGRTVNALTSSNLDKLHRLLSTMKSRYGDAVEYATLGQIASFTFAQATPEHPLSRCEDDCNEKAGGTVGRTSADGIQP
jgi:hypothetical protein